MKDEKDYITAIGGILLILTLLVVALACVVSIIGVLKGYL